MVKFKKVLLATFLVNVQHKKSDRPDQMRVQIGLNADMTPADARAKIEPLVRSMGATCDVVEMLVVENAQDIPESLHRYVKEHGGGFDILVTAEASGMEASP